MIFGKYKYICKYLEPPFIDFKICWKGEETRIAKTILKKEKNVGGFTVPDFNTYYKSIAVITMCCQQKDSTYKSIEQNKESRNRPTQIWPVNC